jgi:integrase
MPKAKQYRLYDTGGLYLEIKPSGKRVWRLKYAIHGKEKTYTMGDYPALGLLKAREQRDIEKENVRQGIDPSARKQEQKRLAKYIHAQSFEAVAREWYQRNCDTWTHKHARNIIRRLELYAFPCFGQKPIEEVTPLDVLDCLQKIEDKGILHTAKRVLEITGQVLRYGVATMRAERDFTGALHEMLKPRQAGHFTSIGVDELPELAQAIERNVAKISRQTILATKLLMLTFVRTNELINAIWDEFDFEKKIWVIPAERMKMRRPHIVPLSRQVIAILEELKGVYAYKDNIYVLPSTIYRNQPVSNMTVLNSLNRLGYKDRMTGHGFRSLATSVIKECLGYRHEVIDRQLAHEHKNKVDKAYDRTQFLDDRVKMMQEWADYVDSVSRCQTENEQPCNQYRAVLDMFSYRLGERHSYNVEYRSLSMPLHGEQVYRVSDIIPFCIRSAM